MTSVKFPLPRQFLRLAAGAAVLPTVSGAARARAYPARPARIVVGFTKNGPRPNASTMPSDSAVFN
jgi:hypothetical protein